MYHPQHTDSESSTSTRRILVNQYTDKQQSHFILDTNKIKNEPHRQFSENTSVFINDDEEHKTNKNSNSTRNTRTNNAQSFRDFLALRYRRKRLTYRITRFLKDILGFEKYKISDNKDNMSALGNLLVILALTMLFVLVMIWVFTHKSRGSASMAEIRATKYLKFRRDRFEKDDQLYEGESKELAEIPFWWIKN